jgi:hypothetical protein
MSAWAELVTTALLGTERRPLPSALPDGIARLASAQGDRGLSVLDAAAGYATYLAAGARPGAAPEPPLAPRQVLDPAPEPAQRLLHALLDAREAALVDEWLRTCTSRGLGVRVSLWTALATMAAGSSGPDRALVRAAVGERGRAFLALNPRWRVVARPAPPSREAAGPGWSSLLTEQALDVVRVTRSLGRRRLTLGPDAALVRRVVAGADLDAWERRTGLAPDAFLGLVLAEAGERREDVVGALADATHAQRHASWASTLARSGYPRDDLVGLVPADDWGGIARGWVSGRHEADQVARLLTTVPAPWAADVGDAVLRHLTSGRVGAATSRRTLRVAALRLPLSASAAIAHAAEGERDHAANRGFAGAERILGLRGDIDRSFRPDHEEIQ